VRDYGKFIEGLGKVFDRVRRCVKEGKYLVVVAQNLRDPEGDVRPLAWDLARRIEGASALKYRSSQSGRRQAPAEQSKTGKGRPRWQFQGERIWCQNTKPLGIWGYPKIFVPNYHHHYCMIFRKCG